MAGEQRVAVLHIRVVRLVVEDGAKLVGEQLILQVEDWRRHCVIDRLCDERRDYGSWLEKIRVVADLAQLHEDVDDGHVVTCGELFFRGCQ